VLLLPEIENLNSSPDVTVRTTAFITAVISLKSSHKSVIGEYELAQFEDKTSFTFIFETEIGVAKVIIPLRGEDGDFIITLPGDASLWLPIGIDALANSHQFHRISHIEEPVSLTQEWHADNVNLRANNTAITLVEMIKLFTKSTRNTRQGDLDTIGTM
jgi:hypothetical protein